MCVIVVPADLQVELTEISQAREPSSGDSLAVESFYFGVYLAFLRPGWSSIAVLTATKCKCSDDKMI